MLRLALTPFRQLAHFAGHDGEAAAVSPSARRLDGSVQCKQVRLLGDRIDRGHYGADALTERVQVSHAAGCLGRRVGNLADALHGASHGIGALLGGDARTLTGLSEILGCRCYSVHVARDICDRANGRLDLSHLLVGAARDRLNSGGQLLDAGVGRSNRVAGRLGACVNVCRRVLDLSDQATQTRQHVAEGNAQRVIIGTHLDVAGEVAPGDRLCCLGELCLVRQ